mmetsp:Transcript_5999/g.10661  ORF Transcript_5999/g.10661 Transcript_5999/m.10661 type:complete len:182 (-) Transcript_5999:643-1188(-)
MSAGAFVGTSVNTGCNKIPHGLVSSVSFSGVKFGVANNNLKSRAVIRLSAEDSKLNVALSPSADTVEKGDSFISVTDGAIAQLKQVMATQSEPSMLRVGVKSGGCSGMSFVMDFDKIQNLSEDDEVVDLLDGEVKICCDPKSLLYLYGMRLDYSSALIGGGFKFYQPNAESTCGCGQSFAM